MAMHPRGNIGRWLGRAALVFLTCVLSSCLYFNTWWNGQKAFDQAERSRLQRVRKNPDDTVKVNPAETELYKRAIAKGSKILETFPEDTVWLDRALMLIARSQHRMYEYENASRKYGELLDAFPWSPLYQPAIQGKVECLLALGRFSEAEEWMRRLDSAKAEGGPAGVLWLKAKVALGRLDTAAARGHLTQLLTYRNVSPDRYGEAAWLLGSLAWAQEDWTAARNAYLHRAIDNLARLMRFRARLRAALAQEKLGKLDQARLDLEVLAKDARYARERPYVYLEDGRMLMAHKLHGDALSQFALLEKYNEPVEAVAEGHLLAGQDAQYRRVDEKEALRLYELSSKAGPATEFGRKARDLADALAELMRMRKQKVADTAMGNWLFSLAELQLLRLDNMDSARAAYGQILSRPGVSREMQARASYAMAWIDEKKDTSAKVWQAVADSFPGTEFAKQAQKNGGIPVTTHTRSDSAEDAFRAAERLWDTLPSDPVASDSALRKVARDWKDVTAGKRALYAVAWIEDHLLNDSAAALKSYRHVVDSLPGTPWARKAAGILDAMKRGPEEILFRKRATDTPDGPTFENDFEEGSETLGTTPVKTPGGFGPQKPKGPALNSPDEPDAIPPIPDGGYMSPDDFQ